ncbi:MAG: hypothetical protein WA705_01525 [Candidatus Ozemobacteraceae bacterium]
MKLRIIWLWITFLTLVAGPVLIGWYVRESRNKELSASYFEPAQKLAEKGNEDGALAIYEFLVTHEMDENGAAMASYSEILAQQNQISSKISSTIKGGVWGFITGEVKDPASLVGCTTGDLIVWGDVRDLVKNTYVYASGGEPDVIVSALSGIGLFSAIAPHLDVGLSVLKSMTKFMGAGLRSGLKVLVEDAKLTGKLDNLTGFVNSVGSTYRKIGMGTLDLIQLSKDSKALMHLSGIIERYGRSAYAAIMIGGKGAIDVLSTAADAGLKLTGSTGKKIIRFGVQYPQMVVRAIKIGKKIGIDNVDITLVAIAETLVSLNWRLLTGIGLMVWLWCFWLEALTVCFNLILVRKQVPA